MILKDSQRGGASNLAAHLMNEKDNDHITVHELRGFVAGDLHGALSEAHAISKATKCQQFMFSLSLNPPKEQDASIDALLDAVDRAEARLGLDGQPRAVIIHEKNGRRHAHAVWSRIDAQEMKAVSMSFFKTRLNELSKELYLEHGWELPEGHRQNGWKNPLNFTLAEWQQAKRLDLDPREVKQVFREAWERSDNQASFRHALEERGFYLAKGDRRGFVALDINGEVFAVARWAGVKTKGVREKLGEPDRLPGVDDARARIRGRMSDQLKGFLAEDRQAKQDQFKPIISEALTMRRDHRRERLKLDKGQKQRWEKETAQRAQKFRQGFGGVMDLLTGRAFATRRENEKEAWQAHLRDRDQRERLHRDQLKERRALQDRFDAMRARQRAESMELSRRIALVWKRMEAEDRRARDPSLRRDGRDYEPSF